MPFEEAAVTPRQQQYKELEYRTFEGYKHKLKSRLYGILCEKEKDGNWEKFLNSVIVELMGLGADSINYWAIIGKLCSLRYLSYEYFRTTIFECMNLISNLEMPSQNGIHG